MATQSPPRPTPRVDPVPAAVEPVMMTDTYVELGGANLRCLCESVALVPDLNPITVTTFCGVQDFPGPVKWHMTATFVQAFGEGGTDDTLSKALAAYLADGTRCPFKVRPYSSRPVSATNPEFSGELVPDYYQPFGGDAGAESTVEIDWSFEGPPEKDTGTGAGHPHITLITPPTGDANSATRTTVTVEGSGFAGATPNLVRFGDQLGTGLTFYGDGSLVANTPLNQPPGPVPISLSYPGLGFVEATGVQFTYVVTDPEEARRH